MAQPARRLNQDDPETVYDEPTGTAPSDPRRRLKALEGGGETTERKRGHLKSADASEQDLAGQEASAGSEHENRVGGGYKTESQEFGRFSIRGKFTRRKAMFGGGLLGAIVAIIMFFSWISGPFEFIHIAQLLEQFHFGGLQSEQDDRFLKQVRLYRYAGKGEVEKTRLSYLGNKFADRFEARLNASGLSSSYSDTFGLFDGLVVNRADERFKGMTDDQIKQYYKDNFGVEPVEGSSITGGSKALKGELVIDASRLSYIDNFKLNYGMLRAAGYNRLSSAIGTRLLCQRAGCTSMLHPLTRKVGSGKRQLESWWNNRNIADKEGSTAPEVTASEDPNAAKEPGADTNAKGVGQEIESDKTLDAKSLNKKLGSAAGLAGLLCIAKGLQAQAQNLKSGQILVLERMAIESMGLGSQPESGQDVNLDQMAQYSKLLHGTDSTGKTTSWDQAASIQSNTGRPGNGYPPNKTLAGVTNLSTPFDFLDVQPLASIIGGVCSWLGQGIMLIGGGIEGLLQSAVLSIIDKQLGLTNYVVDWLAGNAINVDAVGAEYGSEIDYGAALAANSQSMLAGATALSSTQAAAVQSVVNQVADEQFDKQSLTHKLFSPYDQKSVISKVIDSSSPSPTQNIAKMGSVILNFKGAFSAIASMFGGSAKAATGTGYDYGFPTLGFSQQDLTNPSYSNPYDNICHIFGCQTENAKKSQPITGFITGSTDASQPATAGGQSYLTRAQKCFGIQISQLQVQTDNGISPQWNVTSATGELPNPYQDSYKSNNCGDTSDQNWTRLRFFIMDTETMNSMSCYQGDDQACTDIGFSDTSTTGAGASNGPVNNPGQVSGSSQSIAQAILKNTNIQLSGRDVSQDIQDAANGTNGTAGVPTSAAILQLILDVGQSHTVQISAIQSGGSGHCNKTPKSACPDDPHYTGDAVDFSALDGVALSGRDAGSISIMKIAFTVLPTGSGFGQSQCGAAPPIPTGYITFQDTCNHLHVQVPQGTP